MKQFLRRRGAFLGVGFVVVIVFSAYLAYSAYTDAQAQRRAVLTVTKRIEAGVVLTAEMLTTMDVPAPGPDGPWPYATDPAEITGRTALVTLLPDVPIRVDAVGEAAPPGRLLPSGQVVPPGYVAMALASAPLGNVGGALGIADRVTILIPETAAGVEAPPPDQPAAIRQVQTVTYTVLYAGVPVVDLRTAEGTSLIAGEAQGVAAYTLLALTPAQAVEVARYRDVLILALEGTQ